jgi:hypothetical protein
MGLDMYLSVRKYVSRLDFNAEREKGSGIPEDPQFHRLVESLDMAEFLEPGESAGASVEIPVAYWRKAYAIHKWFVDTRADGVDECQPIGVAPEHLEELVALCRKVLDDRSKAEELLPTEGGYFSREYDEWYFEGIEYTHKRLSEVVELMKRTNDKGYHDVDWAVYQASW